jgi:hypothetical protein
MCVYMYTRRRICTLISNKCVYIQKGEGVQELSLAVSDVNDDLYIYMYIYIYIYVYIYIYIYICIYIYVYTYINVM